MLHVQVLSCGCTDPESLQMEFIIYTYATYVYPSMKSTFSTYFHRSGIMTSVNSPACLLARNHFKRSMDTHKRKLACTHTHTRVIYKLYIYIYNINMCDESQQHICYNRYCWTTICSTEGVFDGGVTVVSGVSKLNKHPSVFEEQWFTLYLHHHQTQTPGSSSDARVSVWKIIYFLYLHSVLPLGSFRSLDSAGVERTDGRLRQTETQTDDTVGHSDNTPRWVQKDISFTMAYFIITYLSTYSSHTHTKTHTHTHTHTVWGTYDALCRHCTVKQTIWSYAGFPGGFGTRGLWVSLVLGSSSLPRTSLTKPSDSPANPKGK